MADETLASIAVEIQGDTARLDRDLTRAVQTSQAQGGAAGSAFAAGFGDRAVRAVDGLRRDMGGIRDMVGTFANATGLRLAGQFEGYQTGFTTLIGDAGKAKSLIRDLANVARETKFETPELVGYARGLLATGRAAEKVASDMRTLSDAGSALDMSTGEFGDLVERMRNLRLKPIVDMDALIGLQSRGINLQKIAQQQTGRNMSTTQAMGFFQGMGGERAYNAIVAGMDKNFGGAGKRFADQFNGLVNNLSDNLNQAKKPTGDLLLAGAERLLKNANTLINIAGSLNEATLGGAGLVAVVGLGALAYRKYNTVAATVVGTTERLTLALEKLATSEVMATGGAVRAAVPSAIGMSSAAIAGESAAAGAVAGRAAATVGAGEAAAAGAAGAAGVGVAARLAAARAGSMAMAARVGAMATAMGGPGGIGLIHYSDGSDVRAIVSLANRFGANITTKGSGDGAKTAASGGAGFLQPLADAIDSLITVIRAQFSVLGGGKMSQAAIRQIETEYAMAHSHALTFGVG
jgi:hypothetical protein